tara:strand:+ start:517 stop:717 length:201 start_codon:yes stop_codon:yes gene_type:complete
MNTKKWIVVYEYEGDSHNRVGTFSTDTLTQAKENYYQDFHKDGNIYISKDGFITIGKYKDMKEYMP